MFLNYVDYPLFYQGVFKALNCFYWTKVEPAISLYWLLKEPLIHGARLNVEECAGVKKN